MKFFALVAAAAASKSQFPSFDTFHANCQMTHTIAQDCGNVYPILDSALKNGFKDPAGGDYALKEDGLNDYVWVTRTTPVKHYVDDIIFELSSVSGGCAVNMRSRSETLSVYDYSTNYCNRWEGKTTTWLTYKSTT